MFRTLIISSLFLGLVACGEKPAETVSSGKDTLVAKPEKKDSLRTGTLTLRAINVVHKTAYDSFNIRLNDSMYYANYKGRFFSGDTAGKGRHPLFDLKCEYIIDQIYFLPLDNSRFFVVWQETYHLGVLSSFAVFQRGKEKPDWKFTTKAPSPGPPVIDGESIYVSTLGMIGKLNITDGSAYWMHDSLFDQLSLRFKSFEKPLIYQSTVCYYDSPIKGRKAKRDSLWVNDSTGKFIR